MDKNDKKGIIGLFFDLVGTSGLIILLVYTSYTYGWNIKPIEYLGIWPLVIFATMALIGFSVFIYYYAIVKQEITKTQI